jgi:hypothetical protein
VDIAIDSCGSFLQPVLIDPGWVRCCGGKDKPDLGVVALKFLLIIANVGTRCSPA